MESPTYPPLPSRPEIEPKPRGSWLGIALVLVGAVAITIVLTFLTLGFFGPLVVLAAVIFAAIGLQYLVWGWWFERVYRSSNDGAGGRSGERER
jgi:hypothetical protein